VKLKKYFKKENEIKVRNRTEKSRRKEKDIGWTKIALSSGAVSHIHYLLAWI